MTRRKPITFIVAAAVAGLVALGISACGGGGNGATAATAPATTGNGGSTMIGTASTDNLGTILVDSQGRTLYRFQKDSGSKSMCFGDCASNWPPLRADGKPTVGGGANASMVGTTKRSDGKPQVTYNGHPLYLFAGDQKPGDTNGEGLTEFGGSWYAVSPSGDQVVSQSSSSGGGGFSY
ncbi:MAG TPA: hypothetical protein VKG89_01640 [Solirubrobacterales bacterium]|nr:hypothetical protein [Solirubrobacterales bacterium]